MLDPNHPNVAVLSGFVSLHFLDAIEQLIAHVDTLALELPRGGHALAGFAIAKRIRKKGLKTHVGLTNCHSACTLLFQGGVSRSLNPKATLSYHGVSKGDGDAGGELCAQAIHAELPGVLQTLGFPMQFLSHFRDNSVYVPETAHSALQKGIATEIRDVEYGGDEAKRLARPKVHPCDADPSGEDC